MTGLFLEVLNRSILAGYLILAVIALRLIWKRAPKMLYRILWCLVGIRLTIPFTLESVFSLIPRSKVIDSDILYSKAPTINSGITGVDQVVNPVISESFTPDIAASVNPMQIAVFAASCIWMIVMMGMILYGVISYIRLHYKMADAVFMKENIYQSEKVMSPFVFGFINPRIYLSYSIKEEEINYVIAHERAHIRRCDHLLKALAFILLAVYWFNPLLWIGYYLFCKDLELACDEVVINDMNLLDKKAYSKALVRCSTAKHFHYVSPLAFGENSVKQRVQNILSYKKPTIWIGIVIGIIIVIAVAGFLTNPKDDSVIVLENEGNIVTEHKYVLPDEIEDSNSRESTSAGQTVPVLLKSPPVISLTDTLSSQINEFVLTSGACDWVYIDAKLTEDGVYDFTNGNEVGTAATSLYPTVAAKLVDWLKLKEYQGLDTWLYRLNCEVLPDEVRVREYSIYELGNESAKIRSQKTYTKDMLLIEIIPGRIYEITAIWDESHFEECGYYGEASYILVTDTEFATQEDLNTAVALSELIIEEPEEISLDEVLESASYEVNTLDGVTLQMEKYSSSGGDVEIRNTTDMNIEYGEWYEIQVLVNDKWFPLPYVIENAAFNEPAYMAPKDETVVWEVQWDWLYGELPKGTYRIIKDVMDFRATGDYTKYYLADEFKIK